MPNKLTKLEKININHEIENRTYYNIDVEDLFEYIVFLKSEIDRLKRIVGDNDLDTFESDGVHE